MNNVEEAARAAKLASAAFFELDACKKNSALFHAAECLVRRADEIVKANLIDIEHCKDKPQSFIDRLTFDYKRISETADGLKHVAKLDDPVGIVREARVLRNGLSLKKITVPMGVIAVIYEARPNVTVDAFGLCFKASSAVVLRGSIDAANTNRTIVDIIRAALIDSGVDPDVAVLCECDRGGVATLLSQTDSIDLAIPRGSKALIDFVRGNSAVPVIETGAGNCTAYVHRTADIDIAKAVILNGKTQRTGVCNALESLLIDAEALERSLPILYALRAAGVTVHGDPAVCSAFPHAVAATEEDYYREYLGLDISVKTVGGVKEAVSCINRYGTHHSDVILATDKAAIDYFVAHADSAAVYVNASTRFTDGAQFGLGAEIGISTQKLHARGPMGLNEIVTYKYIIEGCGQTRE